MACNVALQLLEELNFPLQFKMGLITLVKNAFIHLQHYLRGLNLMVCFVLIISPEGKKFENS